MRKLIGIREVEEFPLYDISVKNDHCFELSNGVVAHNSMYGGDVTSGGSGVTYSSSATLMMTKAKEKDATTNEMTGAIVTITAAKSRLTKENTRVKCRIRFDGGLDRYYGLLDIAEASGVFKKVSTRYELPDGSKQFGKAIMESPEKFFTEDVLKKIDDYVKVKFCYGVSGHEDDVFVCNDET